MEGLGWVELMVLLYVIRSESLSGLSFTTVSRMIPSIFYTQSMSITVSPHWISYQNLSTSSTSRTLSIMSWLFVVFTYIQLDSITFQHWKYQPLWNVQHFFFIHLKIFKYLSQILLNKGKIKKRFYIKLRILIATCVCRRLSQHHLFSFLCYDNFLENKTILFSAYLPCTLQYERFIQEEIVMK